MLGSAGFIALGGCVLMIGQQVFLQTRGRKLRRWLSKARRGVALRSFIPEWDNQYRPIFESCRSSRRLAAAYRAIQIGAASCFAAAGCIAAMTIGESIVGVFMLGVSVAATLSVWPTALRIVRWTKDVIDPIVSEAH
ncbi:MAG: hypothetical protein HKN47_16645 [Pirellulaceae bacterium]|nr:hypothetical protein [Pirellulaceae bacterium]